MIVICVKTMILMKNKKYWCEHIKWDESIFAGGWYISEDCKFYFVSDCWIYCPICGIKRDWR